MSPAREAYSDLLAEVVVPYVFSSTERDAAGDLLPKATAEEVAKGRRIDTRSPLLAAKSGKGGWSADPDQARAYARWGNVSLLDHLCSVARGALQFAALDLAAAGLDEGRIRARLGTVAAVAFLHDADKILGKARTAELTAADMAGLMARYGLDRFLSKRGHDISPDQMLALIDEVEITRAGRLRPGAAPPPREAKQDTAYVKLADRLDGIFLDTTRGAGGLTAEIEAFDDLCSDTLRGWRLLELRDPHAPFLLDELQAALSNACEMRHGFPPLVEVHHDGRMVVVVPCDGDDDLVSEALGTVTRELGAAIRVGTTTRGKVDLLDAPGNLADLRAAVEVMDARSLEAVLRVGIDLLRERADGIDELFSGLDFLPRPPDLTRFAGRLVPLWSGTADMTEAQRAVHTDAALLNAVLSCTDPAPALGIPDADTREAELLDLLRSTLGPSALPPWLVAALEDSRRAILAAFAAASAAKDEILHDRLFGREGLAALWLEGHGARPGLVAKIDASGVRLAAAVKAHFGALLAGRPVRAPDETAPGRCHFTNAPVPRQARIDGKTGLYAVNISAFSGREGRPESARSMQAETLVSPIAEAEHRLRQLRFGRPSDRRKVPVRVTSPTTAGLFGALAYDKADDPKEFAFSDVLRAKIDVSRLNYRDEDGLTRRLRIARYEEMPTRLVSSGTEPGQIAFVAMAMACARRLGRPVHVFRGLPRPRPEFVAFDFLPPSLEMLLGGTAFRLEQIPGCLALLRGVETIAQATGFGPELAMRLGDETTRFSAACDALARADRRLETGEAGPDLWNIKRFALNLVEGSKTMMTDYDRALVDFGEAMALVQRAPIPTEGANVAEIGLRKALDVVEDMERLGQVADDSLRAAVAGSIEESLGRRKLIARSEVRGGRSLPEAIGAAADIFVERVWRGAFRRMVPPSRVRRVCLATYSWSFQSAAKAKRPGKAAESAHVA